MNADAHSPFGPAIRSTRPGPPGTGSGAAQDPGGARTYTLRTVNESAGGYCISWQGPEVPRVKVGEIIGIRSVRSPSGFAIGVIRWMKNEIQEGHQLGLEMLAAESSALSVELAAGSHGVARKALLLPRTREPASVLVPPLAFKAGETVRLTADGRSRKATLSRLVETTGAFSHFQLAGAEDPSADGTPSQPGPSFDSVWDSL